MARYIFQGTFRDGQGNIIPDGTVTVYDAGTTTLSTIYTADSGGTAVTSIISDSNGFFYFYIDSSDYGTNTKFDIVLSKDGYTSKTYEDIIIYGQGPEGPTGPTGPAGAKITSVAWSTNDMVFTLDDLSTVTLTGAKTDLKGPKGPPGAGITEETVGFTASGGTTSKTLTVDTDITASNLMLKTGSNLAIGSDADGDMYYRASSVLARLAKGTANHKLFMNAGATAPEWAKGVKIISAIRPFNAVSGDVSYTGVGFRPSSIIVLSGVDATLAQAWGFDDGVTRASTTYMAQTNTYNRNNAFPVLVYGGVGEYQSAYVKSFDADGFTLTWLNAGASTGVNITLSFLCFR